MDKRFSKIYKQQDLILQIVGDNHIGLSLGGGTALHRFHLAEKFRYSEDLDFFVLMDRDIDEFDHFFTALKKNAIPYQLIANTEYFKQLRVFDELKIELIYDHVRSGNLGFCNLVKKHNGVYLDDITNILSNKLECIYSRDEPRDCFDIYAILAYTDASIDEAFSLLIQRTNILAEEVIERLIKCPASFLDKDKILVRNDAIYNDFITTYKALFSKTFGVPL